MESEDGEAEIRANKAQGRAVLLAFLPHPPPCTRNISARLFPHTPEGTYSK